jgi:hypothetical protein
MARVFTQPAPVGDVARARGERQQRVTTGLHLRTADERARLVHGTEKLTLISKTGHRGDETLVPPKTEDFKNVGGQELRLTSPYHRI